MSEKRSPSFNIRMRLRDGSEMEFNSYSGKAVKSKYRNIGAAWSGKYDDAPYQLTLDKGVKLVLADGTELAADEIFLDLKVPFDADKAKAKPATKPAPATKRKPATDPFAA